MKAAAWLKRQRVGHHVERRAGTATCSAKAPKPVMAMTRSPTVTRVTPSPTALTTPAISPPGT